MSKTAGALVLIIAVVAGLIASITVKRYIQSQKAEITVTADTRPVVLAKMDIPTGTTLRPDHIEVVNRPVDSVPEKALSSTNEVIGRMTKTSHFTGEMIFNERLVDPGSPGGLPALIPPGMRAIAISVDDTISVAGFVQPGHHIDVVSTVDVGEMEKEMVSKVILQNIKVIAVGQEIESSNEKQARIVPTVTVLVTPDQAERLALATSVGQVRLVLRNYKDQNLELTDGIKLTSLIPSANQALKEPTPDWEPVLVEEPKPTPREVHTVVVYRGDEKTEVAF